MDVDIEARISKEWGLPSKTIGKYTSFYSETIRPIIKSNYLSHLVTTIENMVNDKRMAEVLKFAANEQEVKLNREQLRSFLASKTFRLYSIVITPAKLRRRATTRYHPSGAIIYYNSCFDEITIRILIAHELGHIVNKELLKSEDTEKTANLFTYIAMDDKNKFYTEECKKFVARSDVQILNDIIKNCPI